MEHKTGQAAIEFLIVSGFLLLVFTGFVLMSIKVGATYIDINLFLDARGECIKFSNLISSVHLGGSGSEIIYETNYLIRLDNSSITFSDTEDRSICSYYTNQISAEVTGTIKIENVDNEVRISNDTA